MKRGSRVGLILLSSSIIGCGAGSGPTEAPGAPLCPRTVGEFGSYGCAVVKGTVRDSRSNGLPGVTVSIHAGASYEDFLGSAVVDDSGTFRATLNLMSPLDHLPDTVEVRVLARATGPYPRPSPETLYSDSVFKSVIFVAAGSPSHATQVALTIRFP